METKTIDNELVQVILGTIKLDGCVTRMDGSKVLWFTDREGQRHTYATKRPDNNPIKLVKERYRSIRGLDREAE